MAQVDRPRRSGRSEGRVYSPRAAPGPGLQWGQIHALSSSTPAGRDRMKERRPQ